MALEGHHKYIGQDLHVLFTSAFAAVFILYLTQFI